MAQPIASHGITTSDIDFSRNPHLVRDMDMPGNTADASPFGDDVQGTEPAGAGLGMVRANPVSGVVENIVVLITFAYDENNNPLDPAISPGLLSAIDTRFSGPQSSLRSYMYAASDGVLTLNSTLMGMNNNTIIMYQDPMPRGYFMPFNAITNPIGYDPTRIDVPGASNTTEGHIRGQQLLARAIDAIDGSALLSGLNLNTINPLQVDSVTFILTGAPSPWGSFLWPHRWSLHLAPATLSGITVMDYSLLMLGTDTPNYQFLSPSIIIHEQLHIFGMPDFYRYTSATRPPGPVGSPVGRWDMMSYSYINDTRFPFSNTHALRRYLGWGGPPVEITASGTFTLHPLGTPGQTTAFAIPVEGRPGEFILLEYRSNTNPTTYDNFLNTGTEYRAGLIISRINTGFRGNARSGDPAFQGGDTSFRDEVYIFRPGTTVRNAGLSNTAYASLSANTGRTSFGDAQGTGYNGIIYTQEGYNTGIEIYNVSVAGATITFSVYLGGSNITTLSPEMLLRQAINTAGGTLQNPTVIYLTQDITLSEVMSPLLVPNGRHVILRGAGGVRRYISAGGNFDTIVIGTSVLGTSASLALEDIGVTRVSGTTGTGILVHQGSNLTLRSGIITGNTHGAVENQGTFIMEGGEIANNTAATPPLVIGRSNQKAGGVTNVTGGNFTMISGTIANNTGVFAGGVRNLTGTINGVRTPGVFTMEGGTISGNTATGVNGGGGVSNGSVFNMAGGAISGNTASRGGGVTNMEAFALFTMTGGTISNNTATIVAGAAAGVLNFMPNATFIMEGGTIYNNTAIASGSTGGGVVSSFGSLFTMTGGSIRNNSAGSSGGGISIFSPATANIQGGEISGNIANNGGGIGIGIAALRAGHLTVGANAVFTDNTARSGIARERHANDDALYASHIHGTIWTDPFVQGFNNFDIEYQYWLWLVVQTLDFELNGTVANPTSPVSIDTIRVIFDRPIMEAPRFPANPTRVGYHFAGWYLNAGLTQPVNAATLMPGNDATLFARWVVADNRNITVNVQGNGTAGANVSAATIGTVITLTATPGFGYEFVEWLVVSGGVTLSSVTTASATFIMTDNDVVVTAVFSLPAHTITFLTFVPQEWLCCCMFSLMISDQWAAQWATHWITTSGRVQQVVKIPHGHSLGGNVSYNYPFVVQWRDAISGRFYSYYEMQSMQIYGPRIFFNMPPTITITLLFVERGTPQLGSNIFYAMRSDMLSDQWINEWETHWATLDGLVRQVISIPRGYSLGMLGYCIFCCFHFGQQSMQDFGARYDP